MSAIRVQSSPKTHDVSGAKVFISYKSEQWETALRIREGLDDLGFRCILVEPGSMSGSDAAVRSSLFKHIDDADYICILASEVALESTWVSFEYKETAALLGRVVFVVPDAMPHSGYHAADRLGKGSFFRQLHIKHTTLWMPEIDLESLETLGIELINDPDEGHLDGANDDALLGRKRNFRKERRLIQAVRKCVLIDHKYQTEQVVDVLPFFPDQLPSSVTTDEEAFQQIVWTAGRHPLLRKLVDGEIDVFRTWYLISGDFLPAEACGIDVFVILEHRDRLLVLCN